VKGNERRLEERIEGSLLGMVKRLERLLMRILVANLDG
jgi:hypothetical protein